MTEKQPEPTQQPAPEKKTDPSLQIPIAQVLKTYGGLEGRRVKAGTRFSIGVKNGDMQMITPGRFTQLRNAGLAKLFDPTAAPAAPWSEANRPARPLTKITRPAVEAAAATTRPRNVPKAQRKPEREPAAPRPLSAPAGSQTGSGQPSASSEEAPQPASSTLPKRKRGQTRGSAGSRSTTPSSSSPGPTSSIPATEPGGDSTKAPEVSKA